jgi:hypothetical protein
MECFRGLHETLEERVVRAFSDISRSGGVLNLGSGCVEGSHGLFALATSSSETYAIQSTSKDQGSNDVANPQARLFGQIQA